MTKRIGIFVGSVLCLAVTVRASDADQNPCSAAQNQLQLTQCWSKAADSAEHRMTEVYKQTTAALRERGASAAADLLQQAQDKWQSYRDAHCAAVSKLFEGGSMEAMQRASCRARLSDQRRNELDVMIADWGGHPSKSTKGKKGKQ